MAMKNSGHALTEALRARDRGVPVFTVPAGGTAPLPVNLESVASPQDVFSGEHFTLSLSINSTEALPARVWIATQGQEVGSTKVDLKPGSNAVNVDARILQNGISLMEVHIASATAEQVLVSQAVTVRSPHVLYISGGKETSPPLLQTLKKAEVDVEMATEFPVVHPGRDWDAVVLDNYPDHELPADEDQAIERYVYAGGGLIFIAGDSNAKLAQEPKTPFEKNVARPRATSSRTAHCGRPGAGQIRKHERAENPDGA